MGQCLTLAKPRTWPSFKSRKRIPSLPEVDPPGEATPPPAEVVPQGEENEAAKTHHEPSTATANNNYESPNDRSGSSGNNDLSGSDNPHPGPSPHTDASNDAKKSTDEGDDGFPRWWDSIMETIRPRGIAVAALEHLKPIRGYGEADLPVVELHKAMYGSFNLVVPVRFRKDSFRCIVRIPGHGVADIWNEVDARRLRGEFHAMKMLKRESSIPIPDVYGFDDRIEKSNPAGCPYVLMEYVEGIPLEKVWYCKDKPDMSPEEAAVRRIRALDGVSSAMIQLGRFSYHKTGEPEFDDKTGRFMGVGPTNLCDYAVLREDNKQNSGTFLQEPCDNERMMWDGQLDEVRIRPDAYSKGTLNILRILVASLDERPVTYSNVECDLTKSRDRDEVPQRFVLRHTDVDLQNIMVDQNGNVVSIIDWDGMVFVPRDLAADAYPWFLAEDWCPWLNAGSFGENRDGNRAGETQASTSSSGSGSSDSSDSESEDDGNSGDTSDPDSMVSLRLYRRIYREMMARKRLETGQGAVEAALGDASTRASLVAANMQVAILNPKLRAWFVDICVDEMIRINGKAGLEDMDSEDMILTMGGDLIWEHRKKEVVDFLRKGALALFETADL
jgi:hypothetical protein